MLRGAALLVVVATLPSYALAGIKVTNDSSAVQRTGAEVALARAGVDISSFECRQFEVDKLRPAYGPIISSPLRAGRASTTATIAVDLSDGKGTGEPPKGAKMAIQEFYRLDFWVTNPFEIAGADAPGPEEYYGSDVDYLISDYYTDTKASWSQKAKSEGGAHGDGERPKEKPHWLDAEWYMRRYMELLDYTAPR